MSGVRPHGSTRDAQYGFSKVVVHDLDAMASFYEDVFGLVPFNRHRDEMFGRAIDEITYQATSPGGGSLTLIHYLDAAAPRAGDSVQGFTTTDIEALVKRAEAGGGSVPGSIRRIEGFGVRVVFVLDPEGHINEVVQMDS
jgi:predicted enzyme related to lactoylglutathione lyase